MGASQSTNGAPAADGAENAEQEVSGDLEGKDVCKETLTVPSELLSQEMVATIRSCLPPMYRRHWTLLFSTERDGNSFNTMLGKIIDRGATLVVVKEKGRGAIFGGFACTPWSIKGEFYGDYSSFLFKKEGEETVVYKATGYNTNFQWLGRGFDALPNGIGCGGQIGHFGLYINPDMQTGHSHQTASHSNRPLHDGKEGGDGKFDVQDIEIWRVSPLTEKEIEAAKKRENFQPSVLDAFKEDKNFLALAGKTSHSDGYR